MSKRLLLSAIFAAGVVGSPALAGEMQVINEEELDEVTAQGFQNISNDTRDYGGSVNQNNNLDSVQMNGSAQEYANAADLVATATSSVNLAINIMWSDTNPPSPPDAIDPLDRSDLPPVEIRGPSDPQAYGSVYEQSNEQTAQNHKNISEAYLLAEAYNSDKETQQIYNNVYSVGDASSSVEGQNNNNNSVQLNGNAQASAKGIDMENSAQSASNTGINIFASGEVSSILGTQSNEQLAENMDNTAEGLSEEAEAYAFNGELGATQSVVNTTDNPEAEINVVDQDNNNNSVQLNDNAQQNAESITINNNANSARNYGINVHSSMGLISESAASQSNDQTAKNHNNRATGAVATAENLNKETQFVTNDWDNDSNVMNVVGQNNNNNSVQLNDNAQENATGLEIRNSAISAYNTGMNIMVFESSENASLSQSNDQEAYNMNNTAEGYSYASAMNRELIYFDVESPTQYVGTWSNVQDQNNNNNSVQLNDNAQANAAGLAIVNNANSAQNTGLNVLVDFISDDDDDDTGTDTPKGINSTGVSQANTQKAENHVNRATSEAMAIAKNANKQTQDIRNAEEVDDQAVQVQIVNQNNNNNSVQLNGNAQQNARGLEITNMAVSAANTGINIAVFHSVTASSVEQTNDQTASNFENYASALGEESGAIAMNGEFAENPGQYVHNVHARIEGQNNNNNSVQLNDNAQENAAGLFISNIAKVALNSGFNVVWVENNTTDSSITQSNTQTAGNHNNTAIAWTAIAMNYNKQSQVIENCYCADILDQNNNQNSVQVNDNAQANLEGWHVLNGASSAVNMATNIMATSGAVSGTTLTQTNVQTSVNYSNFATGLSATAGNAEGIFD